MVCMLNKECGWRWGCKGVKANLGRKGGIKIGFFLGNHRGKMSFETPTTKVKLKIKYKPKKEKETKSMEVEIQYFTTISKAMLDQELSKGEQNKLGKLWRGLLKSLLKRTKEGQGGSWNEQYFANKNDSLHS